MEGEPSGSPAPGSQDRPGARVLVLEDDETVAEVVATYLTAAGYRVEHARDGDEALRSVERDPPDLLVLDLMVPGTAGLEVCRRVRARGAVRVLALTALGSADDRIAGLEAGADDYLTKPFSPRELVLRAAAVLRRGAEPRADDGRPVEVAGIRMDPVARTADRRGAPLALTSREFDLLLHLLRHPGRAFDRETLLREVWGWTHGDRSTVTVHLRRLRAKVEDDPAHPSLLVTVWGVGYRLDPPASSGRGHATGTGGAGAGAVREVPRAPRR